MKLPGRLAALARDQLGPYRVMNTASASRTPARHLTPSRQAAHQIAACRGIMAFQFTFEDLLAYSDWDRAQWHKWLHDQGPDALAIGVGANADGRVTSVGELVRHIFSAEMRYVERSLGLPLTDTSAIPTNDVEALFAFGQRSRRALRQLLATFPETEWDAPREMQLGKHTRTVTPRKMVVQAVTHELRHWAQVATFVRLAGLKSGMHDVIASPLFDAPVSA